MQKKVVIIDYQLGNLFSVKQACEHLGFTAVISSLPEDVLNADYAILPGVGAFSDAMHNLNTFGLTEGIQQYVKSGKPLMGVCLGLQLLLNESEEFGTTKGLGIIPGIVKKFQVQQVNGYVHKVPQIQWNTIDEAVAGKWDKTPLQCCKPGDFMYFVHSFYAKPADEKYVLSQTKYGNISYCSSVLHNNVFATQFHPEKSGLYGVNIYKEWFKLYSN
jgi:imidazole glycerol-phosphate synthase subunit HisH